MEHRKDYLLDYYTLLGLERFSDISLVRGAWLKRVKKVAPDRVQGTEFEEQANWKLALVNEANGVLSDAVQKPVYDELLRNFSGPITLNHNPTVIGGRKFSFSQFLNPEEESLEPGSIAAKMKLIREYLTGFDPDVFLVVEAAYEAASEKTPELRRAYSKVLSLREAELTQKEAEVWSSLGFEGYFEDSEQGDIRQAFEDSLDVARTLITGEIQERVLRLEAGEQLLLEGGVKIGGLSADPDEAQRQFEQLAEERLEAGEEKLQPLIEERAALVDLRHEVSIVSWYAPEEQEMRELLVVVEIQDEGAPSVYTFKFDGRNCAPGGDLPESVRETINTAEAQKEAIERGFSVLFFKKGKRGGDSI